MPDEPTQLSDVIVIGTRAVPGTPRGGGPGGGGSVPESPIRTIDLDAPPIEPESVWTEETAEAENERLKACGALKYKKQLDNDKRFAKDRKEFFTFSWLRNGNVTTHEIREGSGARVSPADRTAVRTEFGIQFRDIVSFTHNHPAGGSEGYCNGSGELLRNQRIENEYPSPQDWAAADEMVGFGTNPETLTLFVVDCQGIMRSYPYSQKSSFQTAYNNRTPSTQQEVAAEGCPED